MKLRLNTRQLSRISEILGNFGLLFIASLVFPVITNPSLVNSFVASVGLVLAIWSIFASIIVERNT